MSSSLRAGHNASLIAAKYHYYHIHGDRTGQPPVKIGLELFVSDNQRAHAMKNTFRLILTREKHAGL